MGWAIDTRSDYVLDVVCNSGYSLEVRDVLSAPRANHHAWNKVREKFNMTDEEALEKIKEYLSKRDNSRDTLPEFNQEPVAAIELLIQTSIEIAYKNKQISQEERVQIKEMVAENGDKISRNTHLILTELAAATAFTFILFFVALKKPIESIKDLTKKQKDLERQVLRQPLLPIDDGIELRETHRSAETYGKPAG